MLEHALQECRSIPTVCSLVDENTVYKMRKVKKFVGNGRLSLAAGILTASCRTAGTRDLRGRRHQARRTTRTPRRRSPRRRRWAASPARTAWAAAPTQTTCPTTPRACGVRTSSRASRRRSPSTRRAAAARSSSPTKARCTVSTEHVSDGCGCAREIPEKIRESVESKENLPKWRRSLVKRYSCAIVLLWRFSLRRSDVWMFGRQKNAERWHGWKWTSLYECPLLLSLWS